MSIFDLAAFNEADIQGIVNSKMEESIYLEFKASGALATTDSKKDEIAKDVSAFANSDGGLLIYGITEQNHRAASFSFIDGDQYPKEWLENVIISRIRQRINGLQIFPVRFGGDISRTIYVVKIPRSPTSPHLSV